MPLYPPRILLFHQLVVGGWTAQRGIAIHSRDLFSPAIEEVKWSSARQAILRR